MNFLDIFSPSGVGKVIDAVIDTGDALVYTDEEKAKANQLRVETKLKMLPLFEPFKLAQRYIAFAFTFNFILAFWAAIILFIWYPSHLDGLLNLVAVYQLGWIMLAIVSFYFGSGAIDSIKRKK